MDVEQRFQQSKKEMEDAEDSLVQAGFPTEQWMLIKEYIHAAIVHNQCAIAKAFEDQQPL